MEISQRRMVIHAGLHKTGTTFLNHTVFKVLPGIKHLGKPFDLDDPVRLLIEDILMKPYGQMDVNAARGKADALLDPVALDGSLLTISDGRLSLAQFADRYLIAERLRTVFGPAQIILTLRRQQDMLSALYYQTLGTDRTKLRYADWVQQFQFHRGKGGFNLLNYHVLVDAYVRAYGRENVHIFLYEQLKADRDGFARALAAILDADEDTIIQLLHRPSRNERMTQAHATLLRRPVLGKMARSAREALPEPVVGLARKIMSATGRAASQLPRDVEDAILAEPRMTNRQLVQAYPLPLAEHCYPL